MEKIIGRLPPTEGADIGEILGKVSASLLNKGLAETGREYKDYFFQPKHPYAALEEVAKRRNHQNKKP